VLSLKKSWFMALLWVLLCLTSNAHATKPLIYTSPDNNLAVGGYDTVAYFTNNRPRKGRAAHYVDYQDARWLFRSEENRQLFIENPERYAPQFGGYCAFSVAQGSALRGNPAYWEISDGKLFLNRSQNIHDRWLERQRVLSGRAAKNWPAVLQGQLESPFRPGTKKISKDTVELQQ